MATTTVYITVRLDIENKSMESISAEDVQELISEIDYNFENFGDYSIDSEICGCELHGQLDD